jgi:DNA-binding XRE family transcriptional regulator
MAEAQLEGGNKIVSSEALTGVSAIYMLQSIQPPGLSCAMSGYCEGRLGTVSRYLSRYGKYTPGYYGHPHMGEVIADYRKRKRLTQEQLAFICKVDKQTVIAWESSPYMSEINRRIFLCRLLSIPPFLLGLTWRSIDQPVDGNGDPSQPYELLAEMFIENAYGLYEDILNFAHRNPCIYSPESSYRFLKHLEELKSISQVAPAEEKDGWIDLLSRYYQCALMVAQHHQRNEEALNYATTALELAQTLTDPQLLGSALYRRSRIHLIQGRTDEAKQDIDHALSLTDQVRGPLKGSVYLLAAEIYALYGANEELFKRKCRQWQEKAANLIYKQRVEEDGTFLSLSLYAVHHERAKTLLRFALFHQSDEDLVELLKKPHQRAHQRLLQEAEGALELARTHLPGTGLLKQVYLLLTESRFSLLRREFEESASRAEQALALARLAHSNQSLADIHRLYSVLHALDPDNMYVLRLGAELSEFH